MNKKLLPLLGGLFLVAASPAFAAISVSLSPNVSSPQPVGTTITWTATVSGDPDTSPVYEYQFSANLTGSPTLIRRGYSPLNTFIWTPSAADGAFTVGVIVKNVHAFTEATHTTAFTLSTRLPAGSCATNPSACAAVNTTNHPLVALFTGTSCLSPNSMVVFFKPTTAVPPGGITATQQTAAQPCRHTAKVADTSSMNFYIAGMYPSTTYSMYYETLTPSNTVVHTGPTLTFTTAAIPSTVTFPALTPSGTSSDLTEPLIMFSDLTIPVMGKIPAAPVVDLAGNIIWYITNVAPIRTELGGNILGFFGSGSNIYLQGFREVDLAGNTVLEESVGAVNEQMVATGQKPIINFNHEVRRMYGPTSAAPTGDILMIADEENVSPSEAECFFDPTTLGDQGGTCTSPKDIFAEQVIILNSNLKLVWNWDEATHFDLNQAPPLGETCTAPGGGGCPPITAFDFATGSTFTTAIDWMHTNSIQYTSYDGNMVVSSRHQDVVFKIAYGNGTGDGHVMWEQGPADLKDENGNALPLLTVSTNNPVTTGSYDLGYPWNSHQHDANIQIINNLPFLTLFDDGDTRVKPGGFDPGGNSRCLLYFLNETGLASNLNIDGDVGTYSFALGSSQLLASGGLFCDSGIVAGAMNTSYTSATETANTTGAPVTYTMQATGGTYRTFRMSSMYNPVLY